MTMPNKILFLTDGNLLEIDEATISESTDPTAEYTYTKSLTKKGKRVTLSLSYINRLIGITIELPKNTKWVSKKSGTSSLVQTKSETAGKTTTELLEIMKRQKKKGGSTKGTKR